MEFLFVNICGIIIICWALSFLNHVRAIVKPETDKLYFKVLLYEEAVGPRNVYTTGNTCSTKQMIKKITFIFLANLFVRFVERTFTFNIFYNFYYPSMMKI